MRRYVRQVSAEQRVYWRNGASAFFTFFLPILFLVFLGLFGRDRIVDGRPYADFFVPGMLGMAVVMTTFAGLAITLVIRRERGMLKRVRGTPLPPIVYLGALVTSTAVVLALEAIVVLFLGDIAFGVPLPSHWYEVVAAGGARRRLLRRARHRRHPVRAERGGLVGGRERDLPAGAVPERRLLPRPRAARLPAVVRRRAAADAPARRHAQRVHPRRRRPHELQGLLVVVLWGVGGAIVALRTFQWEPSGG